MLTVFIHSGVFYFQGHILQYSQPRFLYFISISLELEIQSGRYEEQGLCA